MGILRAPSRSVPLIVVIIVLMLRARDTTALLRPVLARNVRQYLASKSEAAPAPDQKTQTKRRDGLGKPKGYTDSMLQYRVHRHTLSGLPNLERPFTVLGIESSCDDTGVGIVRSDGVVLANVVLSQYEIHEKFGGIVPSLAMEAHKANIDIALNRALQEAGMTMSDVDAIAVTKGPGLEICLRVGCRKAQELAVAHGKPFVAVHHLEAHCMMARLAGQRIAAESGSHTDEPLTSLAGGSSHLRHFVPKVAYPHLALLVSGGHTSLMVVSGMGNYTLLGGTLDDSVGEAFDKAARLLGLPFSSSGGAAVEAAAAEYSALLPSEAPENGMKYRQKRGANSTTSSAVFNMRVPMRDKINCDFSYAGLKNSFRLAVETARIEHGGQDTRFATTNAPSGNMQPISSTHGLPRNVTARLCHHFQDIAFTHLEDRIDRALDWCEGGFSASSLGPFTITALVVVGGVAANKVLRGRLLDILERRARGPAPRFGSVDKSQTEFTSKAPLPLIFPPSSLCTDNGVMAAWAGIEKLALGISDDPTQQEVVARWPLGELEDLSFKKSPSKPQV